MKRTLAVILCLLLMICAAHAETALDTIMGFVRNGLGEKAEVVKVELEDRTLSIIVDMSPIDSLYDGFYADLTTDYAASVTDELLNHRELDDEWDIVFIEAVNVGYFFFTKDDIHDDDAFGVRMRYFPVYDENYNSLITLTDPQPSPTPAQKLPDKQMIEPVTRLWISQTLQYTEVDSITVNDDLGTSTPDDYIVLIHLIWGGGAAGQQYIPAYSDTIAVNMVEAYPSIQELCLFWHAPNDDNVSVKRAYEQKNGAMYLSDEIWAKVFK